jgi:xyloglucan-specific exo-beta-1,4-glucanase
VALRARSLGRHRGFRVACWTALFALSISFSSKAQVAEFHETIRPDEMARLSVASLTTSPTYPESGEKVTIDVGVRNESNVAVTNLHVLLRVDGKENTEKIVDVLPGKVTNLKIDWKPTQEKVYLVTVQLDPQRAIPQTDRVPNTATAQFVVTRKPPAGADLTVASLTVVDSANQPVLASISLKNQGTIAGGGRFVVLAGATRITEILLKPVPAGGQATLKIPLPYGTDTDHLTAELNPRFRQLQKLPQAALFERDVRQEVDLRIEFLSVAATLPQAAKQRRATVSFRIVNHGKQAITTPFRTKISPGDNDPSDGALRPFVFTSSGLAPGRSIYASRSVVLPDAVHEFDAEVQVDIDGALQSPRGHPAAAAHFQNPLPDVGRWYTIGPDHIQEAFGDVGVLFSIALDPTLARVIYVGSHGSGVWKSTLAGSLWFPLTDSLPSLKISAITVDPSQPSRVFVATPDAGIFLSNDSGTTWSLLADSVPLNLSDCCNTLIVDPNNLQSLFLSSFDGVYHSLDGGYTWSLSLSAGSVHSFVLDKAGNRLFASVENSGDLANTGVYELSLNSTNWRRLSGCPLEGSLPTVSVPTQVTLSLSASTLYVAYRTSTTFQLYRSNGGCRFGGQTLTAFEPRWNATGQMIGSDPVPSHLWNSIYSDPVDPNFVYATGTELWRSTDGGATFGVPANGPHVDDHGFAVTPGLPNTTYIVCDGGIFSSNDHGSSNSWQFIGTGISNVEFYDIAIAPTAPNIVIGGTQDNGTELYDSNTSGISWPMIFDSDGGTVAIDPTNAQTFYAMFQYAYSISQSTNGGANWTNVAAGLPGDSNCFNLPFQVHPKNPSILLASCFQLWRASPPGTPWTTLFAPANENVAYSAVDGTSNVYFAGTDIGNIYTGTGGTNWQHVFSNPFSAGVKDIEIDPTNPKFVYVGFAGSGIDRIYLLNRELSPSSPSFATDITSNLPQGLQVRTLAVDPEFTHTIYVGTQGGVFRGQLPPGGSLWFWTPYNTGLPPAVIMNRLTFHPTSGVLRAGTFGRSAFEVYTDSPFGGLVEVQGKITLIRVNDVGGGYGPPTDFMDTDAEVWLDTQPGRAFGFQLRPDGQEADHKGMLKLLRDAFDNNRAVQLDIIRTGVRNGRIVRVMDLPE